MLLSWEHTLIVQVLISNNAVIFETVITILLNNDYKPLNFNCNQILIGKTALGKVTSATCWLVNWQTQPF